MDQATIQKEREFLNRKVHGSQATRKFRAFLLEEGMTQTAAAKAMGMNEEMLSRYLNGEHIPGLRKAQQITKLTEGAVQAYDWLD